MTYFHHELSYGILGLLAGGIIGDKGTLSRCPGPRRRCGLKAGVCCGRRIWIHEQHELDVAACDESVDVIVLEGVDFLEISVTA